jgi:hypothetical protein
LRDNIILAGLGGAPIFMSYCKNRLDQRLALALTLGAMICLATVSAAPALAQDTQPVPKADPQSKIETAPKTPAKAAANTTPNPTPKTTLDTYLEAQLAREKDKHHQYFEGLAKNATETGDYQAALLRARAVRKNNAVYTPNDNAYVPMSARVPGYTPSSAYSVPPRSPVYLSQDLEYAKLKELLAEEKAAQLRKVSSEKEASLDQTLANMKSQMKESHVPGAAVAKPEGSNLFVRYYGPSNTSKPYEVHPAAARIVPHQ